MTNQDREVASVSAGRAAAGRGGHQHRVQRSLAPPHVGEVLGAVLLAVSILAIALAIVGLAVIAGGLTIGGRFGDSPPPNVEEIGRAHLLGGFVVLVLAAAELAVVGAIVADRSWARPVAAAVNGLLALVATLAALQALTAGPDPDVVIALALGGAAAVFTAAVVVLVVQLRRRHLRTA